jgi:hypothetical protein
MALVEPYRQEAKVIARLRERDAVVTTETHGPRWWRRIVGDDACQRIIQVEVNSRKFDDADLAALAGRPVLETLIVGELCNITPAGLCALGQCEKLNYLSIDNHAVSDQGLACLAKLTRLENLFVRGSFTNAGLQSLRPLCELKSLSLFSPFIADDGLAHLTPLKEVRELRLWGRFTDHGMASLKPMANLESLHCGGDPANQLFFAELPSYTEFEFVQCPLIDAAEFLQERHGIPLRVDAETIRKAGSDPMTPITASLANVSLRDGLAKLLAPHDLGWMIHDGALVITTKEAGDRSRANTIALQRSLPRLKEVHVEW